MKMSKTVTKNSDIKLTRPLAYEYDTDTQSVVLLDGFKYEIVYKKSVRNLVQTVDLSQGSTEDLCSNTSDHISFTEDFWYAEGLIWTVYVNDILIGTASSDMYMEELLTTGVAEIVGEYEGILTLTNTSNDYASFRAVPNDPLLVDFSSIVITESSVYSIVDGVFTVCLAPSKIISPPVEEPA